MNILKKIQAKLKVSSLISSMLKMSSATMISRLTGLGREMAMAYYFGAGALTDAFLVAYRIPNLLRDLLAEGAFSSAFVPTLIEEQNKSFTQGNQLYRSLLSLLFLVTSAISILIIIFAADLILLFAPGFKESAQSLSAAIDMVRIMAFYLSFVSLAALCMGVLNSHKIFFLPALSTVIFNLVTITAMVTSGYVASWLNIPPIYCLAIGVLVGGVGQFLFQLPKVISLGYRLLPSIKILTQESVNVFKMLGPGLIGFAATQVNLIVNTILATGTIVGAVSFLSYAFRLFQLPVGVFSVALGNSNLVHFSEEYKKNNLEVAMQHLKKSFDLSFLIILPCLIFLLLNTELVIGLLFQRGEFGSYEVQKTGLALTFYALGLPFYGLYKLLVPVFYTLEKPRIPVMVSIFSIILNIIFCLLMVDQYGYSILALGTSLSMGLNSILLFFILIKLLKLNLATFINLNLIKIILSAGLAGLALWQIGEREWWLPQGFLEQALYLLLFGVILALLNYILLRLVREKNIDQISFF